MLLLLAFGTANSDSVVVSSQKCRSTSNVTLVSAYFRIPGKHTSKEFDFWTIPFQGLVTNPTVIFADKHSVSRFSHDNPCVHVIHREINELKTANSSATFSMTSARDVQSKKHSVPLYVVWTSKVALLAEATRLVQTQDPFHRWSTTEPGEEGGQSDGRYFFWTDIGILKHVQERAKPGPGGSPSNSNSNSNWTVNLGAHYQKFGTIKHARRYGLNSSYFVADMPRLADFAQGWPSEARAARLVPPGRVVFSYAGGGHFTAAERAEVARGGLPKATLVNGHRLSGAFFGGGAGAVWQLAVGYYELVESFARDGRFAGIDQPLLSLLCLQRPERCAFTVVCSHRAELSQATLDSGGTATPEHGHWEGCLPATRARSISPGERLQGHMLDPSEHCSMLERHQNLAYDLNERSRCLLQVEDVAGRVFVGRGEMQQRPDWPKSPSARRYDR